METVTCVEVEKSEKQFVKFVELIGEISAFFKIGVKDSRNKLPFGPESSRAGASSISDNMHYVTLDIRPCPFI